MVKAEIENAVFVASWAFARMVSQVPSPGTEPFADLVKGLRPFGLTPRSVSVQTPTFNLDDVSVGIELLNPRVSIQLKYSGVEMTAHNVLQEDIVNILQIMTVVFESLKKLDLDVVEGTGVGRIIIDLSLKDSKIEDFLSEKISPEFAGTELSPQALAFIVKTDEFTEKFPTRITLAKSASYENALYLDINYQVTSQRNGFYIESPMQFFESLKNHYESLFLLLNLEIVTEES